VDWEIGTPPATVRMHARRRPCVFLLPFSVAVPQALSNVLTGEAPEERHT